MSHSFEIVDVFTPRPRAGNQLAVVTDARGLDTAAMQSISREFNFAETSFILKHQAYFWPSRFLHFGYGCFNFFEASIASSLAFFGCLDLGMIFLQPCRWST